MKQPVEEDEEKTDDLPFEELKILGALSPEERRQIRFLLIGLATVLSAVIATGLTAAVLYAIFV
jgi:hypothetical protein